MSQNAPQRLYLMVVGSMPQYEIPIVCYLVRTGAGRNILIDSGLPAMMPEDESEFENGRDVIEQLASIGLKPDDIDTVISTHYDLDHAGRHASFTNAHYVVQRAASFGCGEQPAFCCQSTPMGPANGAHSAGGRGHGTAAGAGVDRDERPCAGTSIGARAAAQNRGGSAARSTPSPSPRALRVTRRTTAATRTPKRSARVRRNCWIWPNGSRSGW